MKLVCFVHLLLLAVNTYAKVQPQPVTVTFRYDIAAGKKTKQAKLICLLPQGIANRQEVLQTTFSVQPSRLFRENGNLYAEFVLDKPHRQQKILIAATMHLYPYDLQTAGQEEPTGQTLLSADSLQLFLQAETFIEKDNAAVAALAAQLKGADATQTLKNIYSFVNHELHYSGYNTTDQGAASALSSRTGDCSEFADLFVALCRASNIPARTVDGYITDWTNTPKHSWVEVYMPAQGWVPFDPTPGNQARFGSMRNRYIYLSAVRNDHTLNNFHFYTHLSWGEPIRVSGTFQVSAVQEPLELAKSAAW